MSKIVGYEFTNASTSFYRKVSSEDHEELSQKAHSVLKNIVTSDKAQQFPQNGNFPLDIPWLLKSGRTDSLIESLSADERQAFEDLKAYFDIILRQEYAHVIAVHDSEQAGRILANYHGHEQIDALYAMFLDEDGSYLGIEHLWIPPINEVKTMCAEIIEDSSDKYASRNIILGMSKQDGRITTSEDERTLICLIKSCLQRNSEIAVIDAIKLGDNQHKRKAYTSMKSNWVENEIQFDQPNILTV